MNTLVKNALIGLSISASMLLLSAAPAGAQVQSGSVDAAGYAGYLYVNNLADFVCQSGCPLTNNHGIYGANGGYNITPHITVLGEFGYAPLYSGDGLNLSTKLYGGGARFNINPKSRIVGYGIFTAGGDTISGTVIDELSDGDLNSVSGYYISFGGGASYYLGSHWGVRPEFRYLRPEYSVYGQSYSASAVAMTGGVFYQFGGHGKQATGAQ